MRKLLAALLLPLFCQLAYAEWAMMTHRIPWKEYREEVVAKFEVAFTQDGSALKISLPGQAPEATDTVLKVPLAEPFPTIAKNSAKIRIP